MNIRFAFELLVFLIFSTMLSLAHAAPPVLSDALITNVTDRSFTLIWTTDQPGQASIELYADSAATSPVNQFSVKLYPVLTGEPGVSGQARIESINSITQAAQSFGIVALQVTDLIPDTNYYLKFGLQTAAQESSLCPDAGVLFCPDTSPSLLTVQTASSQTRITPTTNILFENDVAAHTDQQIQVGELLIIGVENARYPLSVFVGDGMTIPYTLMDLNNLFSYQLNVSMQVNGSDLTTMGDTGEAIAVRLYRGRSGSTSLLSLMGKAGGNGSVVNLLSRSIGDCNGDGQINGYDALLIGHAVAGTINAADYSSVAFHPVLCNLFSEQGLHNVMPVLSVDDADKSRVDGLLIGTVNSANLPEVP